MLNSLIGSDYLWSMLGHSPWMSTISEEVRKYGMPRKALEEAEQALRDAETVMRAATKAVDLAREAVKLEDAGVAAELLIEASQGGREGSKGRRDDSTGSMGRGSEEGIAEFHGCRKGKATKTLSTNFPCWQR